MAHYQTKIMGWGILFFFFFLLPPAVFAENVLRVGIYQNPPKIFLDEQNQPVGFYPRIMTHIAQQEGWELEYIPCAWADCLEMVEQGELDLMPDVAWTEERARRFEFNQEVILSSWSRLYANEEGSIRSILDLDRKRIAVLKDSFQAQKLVKEAKAFDINPILVEVEHFSHIFEMVEQGVVDAGIANRFIGAQQKGNYKIIETDINLFPARLHFAAPKAKNGNLLARLDEHLVQLKTTPGSIYYRSQEPLFIQTERVVVPRIKLTDKELAWLSQHPRIRIGVDADFAPYSFRDKDGNYHGIAMEFTDYISRWLGIQIEVVPDLSWPEIANGVRKRDLDLVVTMTHRPEREAFVNFTEAYLPTPLVIMRQIGDKRIQSETDLDGHIVAMVEGYSSSERVMEEYLGAEPLMVKTPLDGLFSVATGKADAYVGVLGINLYLARENGIINLEVASLYGTGVNAQRFGVRKDWPELVSILDKALVAIPEEDKQRLFGRWLAGEAMQMPALGGVERTAEEQAWLDEHPEITLGFTQEFEPLVIVGAEGQVTGMTIDIYRELETLLGIKINVEIGAWPEIIKKAEVGELDGLVASAESLAKSIGLLSTKPITTAQPTIYARTDTRFEINSLKDIHGKRVAVMKGIYTVDQALLPHREKLELIEVDTALDMLTLILEGKADVAVGLQYHNYLINKHMLIGLKAVFVDHKNAELVPGSIRAEWPEYISLINKAIDKVGRDQISQISQKWTQIEEKYPRIEFTPAEQKWLAQHPALRLGYDIDWPPVEYADEKGRYQGMSAEYMALIAESLGVTFEPAPPQSWQATIAAAKAGQLDIISAVARTPQRDEYLRFTEPYLSFPMVIVTDLDYSFVSDIGMLEGKAIAVVEGYASHDFLKNEHPELILLPVRDIEVGLQAVQQGEAAAFIDSIASVSHVMGRLGIPGLKISGEAPYRFELGIGIRKDQPLLAGIMQKALDAIPEEKRIEIHNRWVSVTYERGIDYILIWQIVALAVTGIGIFFVWNLSLKRTVARRTADLRQSEENLKRAQTVASMGSWRLNIPDNALLWSDETYRMFGMPRGTPMTYEKFMACMHPADRTLVDESWKAALTGTPYDIEHRIVVDGGIRWVNEKVKFEYDEEKNPLVGIGTVQDITERKLDEWALARTTRALRVLTLVNEAMMRATDESTLVQTVCNLIVQEGGYRLAWIGRSLDDENRTIEPVAWGGYEVGYIEQLKLTWADTERGRGAAGCAVRDNRPVVIHDVHSDTRFTPWRADAIERGYNSACALPINEEGGHFSVLEVYAHETDAFDENEVNLLTELASDIGFGVQVLRSRKERDRATVELREAHDQLERRVEDRTRELSEANLKLQELDKLKSMFIASMSHELRTPLNSIIGFSGMMLEGISGDLNEVQRDNLMRVLRSGRHLLDLITDVIDISKIEAGRIEVYPQQFSLKELVDEALETIQPQMDKKQLTLEVDATGWPQVLADRKRLLQCLLNYLSNAVKFTEEGGVTVMVRELDANVEIAVRDTGIGIAEDDIPKLFEAFERLETHLRVKAGGSGLGLYLTKKITVELLQGGVAVKSEVGKGSTFILRIPKEITIEAA